jgi:hypothetical protein
VSIARKVNIWNEYWTRGVERVSSKRGVNNSTAEKRKQVGDLPPLYTLWIEEISLIRQR